MLQQHLLVVNMPTDSENIHFLYLILTHGGAPNINWAAVATAMDLKSGAVSKRWYRLKQSMDKGETPAASNYPFLWLCVKHDKREHQPNWPDIAHKCGTTPGAASKRYSRMKQAFEHNPPTPANDSPGKSTSTVNKTSRATPKNNKRNLSPDSGNDDEDQVPATPTPKRKRASSSKKMTPATDDEGVEIPPTKNESEDEDAPEEELPKRKKSNSVTVKPKPKPKHKGDSNGKPKLIKCETPASDADDNNGLATHEALDNTLHPDFKSKPKSKLTSNITAAYSPHTRRASWSEESD
ncbi:hypothetical protein IAQ61_003806 [Plenodomus lingam]|uniref:uncharacterized protein n=1 Tax=Leptosphaeria maculans TaxID=5022 RepID=UPI003316E13B|nr:hypothetical protein IAQ61_003806 [Plenodomus lingam]